MPILTQRFSVTISRGLVNQLFRSRFISKNNKLLGCDGKDSFTVCFVQ